MSQETPKRVSDVAPAFQPFEGQKVSVRDLVGKEFVITRVVKLTGDKGPYVAVQIEHDDWQGFFFSSHTVIFRKLMECVDVLPLLAKISLVTPDGDRNPYFNIE